jgi:hypothetical protein
MYCFNRKKISEVHGSTELGGMSDARASFYFWAVAVLYGVFWTIFPYWLLPTYRIDIHEMLFVGKEGVLATFKHPALNSLVLEILFERIGFIAPYLLGQTCFLATAWTVWRLGRKFLAPREALFGALCFYGSWMAIYPVCLYYNHNSVLFVAWGFTTLFAFNAVKQGRCRDWLWLGVAVGIGMYCKITLVALVAAIFVYMLVDSSARRHLFRPGPYLAALVSLLIASPLVSWMVQSEFSFLRFPVLQYGLEKTLGNRFYALAHDGLLAPLLFISSAVLLLPLFIRKREVIRQPSGDDSEKRYALRFLLGITVIAWLLLAIPCFTAAVPKKIADFLPLAICSGPLLLACRNSVGKAVKANASRRIWVIFGFTMVAYVIGFSVYASSPPRNRTQVFHLPGRELAAAAGKIWHGNYREPLPFIVGKGRNWIYAGVVATYSPERPSFYGDYVPSKTGRREELPLWTWATDADVLRRGGLAIWEESGETAHLPEDVKERYPSARLIPAAVLLHPYRTKNKSLWFGFAMIPPDETIPAKPLSPAPLRLW